MISIIHQSYLCFCEMAAQPSIEMDIDETSHKTYTSEAQMPFQPTGKTLGGGAFGKVVEVHQTGTNKVYAAKVLRRK